MPKTQLLVICPKEHPALRYLAPIHDLANIAISDDQAELEREASDTDVILFTGIPRATVNWPRVWQHATHVRWVHSLSDGWKMYSFRHSSTAMSR